MNQPSTTYLFARRRDNEHRIALNNIERIELARFLRRSDDYKTGESCPWGVCLWGEPCFHFEAPGDEDKPPVEDPL